MLGVSPTWSLSLFLLTEHLEQLADVVPPERAGDSDGGRVGAVVHGLAGPAVVDLARGHEDLGEDVEVEAGAGEVVHHHQRPQVQRLAGRHQPGPVAAH